MSSALRREYAEGTSERKTSFDAQNLITEREILKSTKALSVRASISVPRFWEEICCAFAVLRFCGFGRFFARFLVGPHASSIRLKLLCMKKTPVQIKNM